MPILLLSLACAPSTPPVEAEEPAPAAPPPVAAPEPLCDTLHSPFPEADRRAWAPLKARLSSNFGDHRSSYVKGHKHAGVDLKTDFGEAVYPICPGRVVDIHLASPHRTIVVEHRTSAGEVFWSSYKHVEALSTFEGQEVTEESRLARVFTAAEQAAAPWKLNHLHFELRRSIADGGEASWTAMSMEELEIYARDPAPFFEQGLEGAPAKE